MPPCLLLPGTGYLVKSIDYPRKSRIPYFTRTRLQKSSPVWTELWRRVASFAPPPSSGGDALCVEPGTKARFRSLLLTSTMAVRRFQEVLDSTSVFTASSSSRRESRGSPLLGLLFEISAQACLTGMPTRRPQGWLRRQTEKATWVAKHRCSLLRAPPLQLLVTFPQ